ncbi:GTP 3',8-cyclase MoaA [uncultured Maricaulis sp.]|uniref:GTP 3',8-cyclase MoaA n=1 Tax=uncultured Maricaulis sp. TaxID=174710 RepID=UPI0030D80652|tara:strand:+ start:1499 stop:2536 length:1038 start_codon:yes stop_codon:yes gene_type:complete
MTDATATAAGQRPLIDHFGRHITYLRLSVTDRCDLRCVYCMKARPDFLPKSELLTLEELTQLSDAFIRRGVTKIRVTGGEPLVRRDVMTLIENLGARLGTAGPGATGLEEICLTTNATQLPRFARDLVAAGVKRINVSLDTLDEATFARLTRGGRIADTLAGIDAADAAGLKIKINTVALKDDNEHSLRELIAWAHGRGFDLTLIEIMPLGEVDAARSDQFLSLAQVKADLEQGWTLTPLTDNTGGPARYHRVEETGGRLGLITPLTENFCAGCNRVRLTCTGQLYMCLGRNGRLDLRAALREGGIDAVDALLDEAMALKPQAHDFDVSAGAEAAVGRTMAHTGG